MWSSCLCQKMGMKMNYCRNFYQLVESGKVAAFIFEPLVLGSAGMKMYDAKFLDKLLKVAQDKEVICIAE